MQGRIENRRSIDRPYPFGRIMDRHLKMSFSKSMAMITRSVRSENSSFHISFYIYLKEYIESLLKGLLAKRRIPWVKMGGRSKLVIACDITSHTA